MTIGVAVQVGNFIKVYDELGAYKATFPINRTGKLIGYTLNRISVYEDGFIKLFDEYGNYKVAIVPNQ